MGNYSTIPSGPPNGPNPGNNWVVNKSDSTTSDFNTACYVKGFKFEQPSPDMLPQYEGKEPVSVTTPDGARPIRVAKVGSASKEPATVMTMFNKAVDKFPSKAALKYETNVDGVYGEDSKWVSVSWKEYQGKVRNFARSLLHVGLQRFEAVNVIGFNSPEWAYANMGAIFAGGMVAGIYTTNGPEACKYISEHSEAAVIVCQNAMQMDKFYESRNELPKLKALVQWQGQVDSKFKDGHKVQAFTFDEFMALGADEKQEQLLEERIAAQKPSDCCTLIYTSGTTGAPKAVMISHDNATWTAQCTIDTTFSGNTFAPDYEAPIVSYLPLSHVAAQLLDFHSPYCLTARFAPSHTAFARPDALKGTLVQTLNAIRPAIFFGVPRVWEKMEEKLRAVGAKTTGIAKSISTWAKGKGAQKYRDTQVGGSMQLPGGISIANSVFSKIKTKLGLDKALMCLTGAAPIRKETLEYFGQLDINICELYGMSENTGPQTLSLNNYHRAGSCGIAMPGVELKIDTVEGRDEAPNGEICFRGRHIMMGYMKNPDKTAEAIDPEGWLHSGDVGRVDENGLLYITGRIKELIVTAGGENIAPVPIEEKLMNACPQLSGCMMVGDKKKYNVVLVTLHQKDDGEGGFTDDLVGASAAFGDAKTIQEARESKQWTDLLTNAIKEVNKTAVSNAAKMQKFFIVPPFSVPNGELTPTLKLKRPIVMKHYVEEIEWLYGDNKTPFQKSSTETATPEAAPADDAAPATEE